jgi:TfoX/Sxy family transcriptional regulator of competence genes
VGFDERLAQRIRRALSDTPGVTERKMFGGIAFMVHGNMCCGIIDDRFIVRVGRDAYEESLTLKHASEMDYAGRPMRGFVYVSPEGTKSASQLRAWVKRGLDFVDTLPAK